MSDETCSACRFWKRVADDDDRGQCRKVAPTVISGMVAEAARDSSSDFDLTFECTMFPVTDCDAWCGEFYRADFT